MVLQVLWDIACQLDMSSSNPILDDQDESPILDLGAFMSIPVASAQKSTLLDVPCIQNLATPPDASGLNSAHAHLIVMSCNCHVTLLTNLSQFRVLSHLLHPITTISSSISELIKS